MNLKRAISALAALAVSVSCMAGLAISANAADGATEVDLIGTKDTAETFDSYTGAGWTSDLGAFSASVVNGQWGLSEITEIAKPEVGAAGTDYATYVSGKALTFQKRGAGESTSTYAFSTPVTSGNLYFNTDIGFYNNKKATDGMSIALCNPSGAEVVKIPIAGSGTAQNISLTGSETKTTTGKIHPRVAESTGIGIEMTVDLDAHTATCKFDFINEDDSKKRTQETVTVNIADGSSISRLVVKVNSRSSTNNALKFDNTKLYAMTTAVQTADYSVTYVDEQDNEIKTARTANGVVGEKAVVIADDKASFKNEAGTKKYIYVSDNADVTDITVDNNASVKVVFREAAAVAYTVKTNFDTELANANGFEADVVNVPYPMYILKDKVVYTKAKQSSNPWYGQNITLGTNATQNETFEYTKYSADNTEGVFYGEGEDIFTKNNVSNANVRCSMGAGGDISEKTTITTLPAGTYHLTAGVWGASGNTYTFTAGTDTIKFTGAENAELTGISSTGSKVDMTSKTFVLTEETTISVEKTGEAATCVDYVLIEKIIPNVIDQTATTAVSGNLTEAQIAALTQVGTSDVSHGLTAASNTTIYTVKVNNYDGTSLPQLVIDDNTTLTPSGEVTYGYQDGDAYVFVIQTVGYDRAKSVKVGDSTLTFAAN